MSVRERIICDACGGGLDKRSPPPPHDDESGLAFVWPAEFDTCESCQRILYKPEPAAQAA